MASSWVAQIIFGILATILVKWFSRRREYRADAMGAKLTSPGAMANALERLKNPAGSQQDDLPETMAAFGISPGFQRKLGGLMATHPPLDERIAALRSAE